MQWNAGEVLEMREAEAFMRTPIKKGAWDGKAESHST
jgi:hypothetical protein